MSDNWQKKLRYRGFRLLGFSLPLLILSLVAASFIPRRPPLVLSEGDLPHQKKHNGRLVVPAGIKGELPLSLILEWPRRPPTTLRLELQLSDADGELQRKIKVKAKGQGGVWTQRLDLRLQGGGTRTFQLTSLSSEPVVTHYRLTAFAGTPLLRVLRMVEMLFYPALAFVLLSLVMVLFPSFVQS